MTAVLREFLDADGKRTPGDWYNGGAYHVHAPDHFHGDEKRPCFDVCDVVHKDDIPFIAAASKIAPALRALLDEVEGLRVRVAEPLSRVCCGEYATCVRACTPRGEWKAMQIQDISDLRTAYDELIYAVATVTPGETRHQTALRYISERENRPAQGPVQATSAGRA